MLQTHINVGVPGFSFSSSRLTATVESKKMKSSCRFCSLTTLDYICIHLDLWMTCKYIFCDVWVWWCTCFDYRVMVKDPFHASCLPVHIGTLVELGKANGKIYTLIYSYSMFSLVALNISLMFLFCFCPSRVVLPLTQTCRLVSQQPSKFFFFFFFIIWSVIYFFPNYCADNSIKSFYQVSWFAVGCYYLMVGHKNEHARRYLRYLCSLLKRNPSFKKSYWQFVFGSLKHICCCTSPLAKPPPWRGLTVLHGLPMGIPLRWRASMTKPWLPTSLLLSWWKGRLMIDVSENDPYACKCLSFNSCGW